MRILLRGGLLALGCTWPMTGPDAGVVDAGDDRCKHGAPQVLVGEGQSSFHALQEGEVLVWEAGPQGGHHIWVALLVAGVQQAGTLTTVDLVDLDFVPARTLQHRRVAFVLAPAEGSWCALYGLRMQLDEDPQVELGSLAGHHVRIVASVTDSEGASATGEEVVVVRPPADGGTDGG